MTPDEFIIRLSALVEASDDAARSLIVAELTALPPSDQRDILLQTAVTLASRFTASPRIGTTGLTTASGQALSETQKESGG